MKNAPRLTDLDYPEITMEDFDEKDDHCHACHGAGCVACRNDTTTMERFRREAIWDRMENEV